MPEIMYPGTLPGGWQQLPGASQTMGRPWNDPLRRQCEGNGGVFTDMTPPIPQLPGQPTVSSQSFCDINGRQSHYDRGAWNPPLTALSGFGAEGKGGSPLMWLLIGGMLYFAFIR